MRFLPYVAGLLVVATIIVAPNSGYNKANPHTWVQDIIYYDVIIAFKNGTKTTIRTSSLNMRNGPLVREMGNTWGNRALYVIEMKDENGLDCIFSDVISIENNFVRTDRNVICQHTNH